jgi:hypothetical protein
LLLGAGACPIRSFSPINSFSEVTLPVPGPTFLVECNYEFANCSRKAQETCPRGRFEQITRKSCPACSKDVPLYPQTNAVIQQPGYRGKLYFRCEVAP